jgi:hypothetical protein
VSTRIPLVHEFGAEDASEMDAAPMNEPEEEQNDLDGDDATSGGSSPAFRVDPLAALNNLY